MNFCITTYLIQYIVIDATSCLSQPKGIPEVKPEAKQLLKQLEYVSLC